MQVLIYITMMMHRVRWCNCIKQYCVPSSFLFVVESFWGPKSRQAAEKNIMGGLFPLASVFFCGLPVPEITIKHHSRRISFLLWAVFTRVVNTRLQTSQTPTVTAKNLQMCTSWLWNQLLKWLLKLNNFWACYSRMTYNNI